MRVSFRVYFVFNFLCCCCFFFLYFLSVKVDLSSTDTVVYANVYVYVDVNLYVMCFVRYVVISVCVFILVCTNLWEITF